MRGLYNKNCDVANKSRKKIKTHEFLVGFDGAANQRTCLRTPAVALQNNNVVWALPMADGYAIFARQSQMQALGLSLLDCEERSDGIAIVAVMPIASRKK